VDGVVQASSVSHDTGVALAGAAAVAAAVSAGLEGATVAEAIGVGRQAAELGAARGHWVAAADVSARIGWAVGLVSGTGAADAAETIYTLVGTSLATQESVPAAFAALAVHPDDPWAAMLLAASVGGDCDTIAAMAGAMAGACHGMAALPEDAVSVVRTVNDLRLEPVVDRLLALRARRRDPVGAA
jgi:ADP-ribosylglycohydrolase